MTTIIMMIINPTHSLMDAPCHTKLHENNNITEKWPIANSILQMCAMYKSRTTKHSAEILEADVAEWKII